MPAHRMLRTAILTLTAILLAGALPACKKAEAPPDAAADPVAAAATATTDAATAAADDLTAKLVQADAADGAADKVVSQCLMCALRMKGDAAQAVEYEGYTIHLCSPACKSHFEKNPATAIAAVDLSTE